MVCQCFFDCIFFLIHLKFNDSTIFFLYIMSHSLSKSKEDIFGMSCIIFHLLFCKLPQVDLWI